MMKWESVLRRDSEAFSSFITWLKERRAAEIERLMITESTGFERQKGVVDGIEMITYLATAADREEKERARRAEG